MTVLLIRAAVVIGIPILMFLVAYCIAPKWSVPLASNQNTRRNGFKKILNCHGGVDGTLRSYRTTRKDRS